MASKSIDATLTNEQKIEMLELERMRNADHASNFTEDKIVKEEYIKNFVNAYTPGSTKTKIIRKRTFKNGTVKSELAAIIKNFAPEGSHRSKDYLVCDMCLPDEGELAELKKLPRPPITQKGRR